MVCPFFLFFFFFFFFFSSQITNIPLYFFFLKRKDMRTSLRGDACAPLHQRTQMVSDILVTLVCAAGSIGCGLMATTVLYQVCV